MDVLPKLCAKDMSNRDVREVACRYSTPSTFKSSKAALLSHVKLAECTAERCCQRSLDVLQFLLFNDCSKKTLGLEKCLKFFCKLPRTSRCNNKNQQRQTTPRLGVPSINSHWPISTQLPDLVTINSWSHFFLCNTNFREFPMIPSPDSLRFYKPPPLLVAFWTLSMSFCTYLMRKTN